MLPKSLLRESDNCVQQLSTVQYITHSSSDSDINLDEITDNLVKYKQGVEEEENNKKDVLRKLLFLDDNFEKKNDVIDFSNTLVFTPKDKPDTSALEISDLKCERMNSKKLQQISEIKPIPEEKSEELLKSQRLIEGLKDSEFITLYDRNKKEEVLTDEGKNPQEIDKNQRIDIEEEKQRGKDKKLIEREDIVIIDYTHCKTEGKFEEEKKMTPEQINEQHTNDQEPQVNIQENGEHNKSDENNKNNPLDADEHLSELSQFLKDAGLITEAKFNEDESPKKEANVKVKNNIPTESSNIAITHINHFEIPSRQSVTPASLIRGNIILITRV